MINRRDALLSGAAMLGGAALMKTRDALGDTPPAPVAASAAPERAAQGYMPVVTPNGATLPWRMDGGVKVFHLVAEPVKREFAPGMIVDTWGYNGLSPGPTIEVVEGDRVRLLVTNKLPERTSVHWHGALLPNGMDGVAGLNQPHIEPGETYQYEFTLRQSGTLMYHPHSDEMVQMALGMMGFFIVHPRVPEQPRVDRDFAIMLHEWSIAPGTSRPNPAVMTDFNLFTFNARVWPGTAPLVVKRGDRVRVRLGNLSMDSHPIHLHGYRFETTGTEGGRTPASARARDDRQRSGRRDARRRVGRRRARRLGLSLPQVPPHDELDEPRAAQHARRQAGRGGGEGPQGAARLHVHGEHGNGRHDGYGTTAEHAADDDRTGSVRRDRDGRHVHRAQGPRGDHELRGSGLVPSPRRHGRVQGEVAVAAA